ncbi:MAG TPA: tyrosine-type recombinase/integrase [Pseudonocardiaceae bacterium]|nr:tyrosine-type recombinase/integrase [Pseudonocardiaceae bacterium]
MDSEGVARRPGRIVVGGMLAPFADGLRSELARQGYAADTIVGHVRLLADLSGWLSGRGLTTAELTNEVARAFLHARRAAGYRTGVSDRALAPILGYLRGLGAVSPSAVAVPVTPLEVLLAEYRRYLEEERGLAAGTVVHYLRYARLFLIWLPGSVERSLPQLSAGQVIDFVRDWTSRRRSTALDMVILPALRSLLRFLHIAGHVRVALAGAVPAGRGRARHLDQPRAACREDVRAVLAGCDRNSAVGCRDYAILLMLARLAVRGGEVARLELADVHWQAGELRVRGKGGRVDVLPLPADVGAAVADYLLHARPATAARNLFVTVKAPFAGLATSSVTVLVAAACARVGVSRFGPHGMRHAVACDLLAAGASMEEIGQLLRHAQQRTTTIYARLDQARLAELAMPCPQGAAR